VLVLHILLSDKAVIMKGRRDEEAGACLLGTGAPCYYRSLSESAAGAPSQPRLRSNSIAIFTEEEDVVFTSYGPVVIQDEQQEERPVRVSRSWLVGWLLAVISGVLFTANNFLVKYYSIDAVDMLLARSALQTVIMALVIVASRRPFMPSKRLDQGLVILQGLIGGLRILLQFACVLYMPLGDALTIVFTEPLWTILLSRIILSIRISAWKMIFGCLLISGMVLCIQPPFLFTSSSSNSSLNTSQATDHEDRREAVITEKETDYYIGVIFALGTAVTGALANVSIARCERVSSKVLVFYSGLGGVLISLICAAFDSENKIILNISAVEDSSWLLLLVLGLMGILGYFALTRSLRLIPPTTVAVLRAMEIILAYAVEALVMGEIPNGLSLSGSTLVMVSVVAFAMEQILADCCANY